MAVPQQQSSWLLAGLSLWCQTVLIAKDILLKVLTLGQLFESTKRFELSHFCHLSGQLQERAAATTWPAHLNSWVDGQVLLGGCIVCQSCGVSEIIGVLPAANHGRL